MGTEVSTIKEVIVEDELVVSDIIFSQRNHQKKRIASSNIKQLVMKKNK